MAAAAAALPPPFEANISSKNLIGNKSKLGQKKTNLFLLFLLIFKKLGHPYGPSGSLQLMS